MKNHKTLRLVVRPDSSYIKEVDISVNRITEELIVTFKSGARYAFNLSGLSDKQYEYIVRGMFNGLPEGKSIGKFFATFVKDNPLINARKLGEK